MNGTKIKKLGCTGCPNYCEPRAGYPAGTCLEVPSYQHGLDKIEECPLVEQAQMELDGQVPLARER